MTSEIMVPHLSSEDQRLTSGIARHARGEIDRLEAALVREQQRYGLDSAVERDATGRARLNHTMATSVATRDLARTAREVRAELAEIEQRLHTTVGPAAEIAREERRHLVERIAWTHPALAGLLGHPSALGVVAAGPDAEAARTLVESITRRRAALIHVRTLVTRQPANAWALVELVDRSTHELELLPAARRAARARARDAASAAEGAALARAFAIGSAGAR